MERAVVTIGNFDGVHVGHKALIERARAIADGAQAKVVALAFDPHPTTKLRPAAAPARITDFALRTKLLKEAGADEVVKLEPTEALLSMTPDEFLAMLMRERHPVAIVEGPDFNYGKNRAGSIETLVDEGKRMGFAVEIVQPVEAALSDLSIVRVSSTLVRHLIATGRVRDASLLLGRGHEIAGIVAKGDQRGRTIGFPTANIVQDSAHAVLLPAEGVYAATAKLPDGRTLPAAVNIGSRPTFNAPEPRIEAHIIDPASGTPAPGLPEYGWQLSIELVGYIRDTVKFAGLEALKAQLERDRRTALRLVDSSLSVQASDLEVANGFAPTVLSTSSSRSQRTLAT